MRAIGAMLFLNVVAGCAGLAPAVSVPAVRETAAVDAIGDAADDPAIWVAPQPERSLVLATQKQGGLYVFDLDGAVVQTVPGGRPNNIDLRDGFAWREGAAPLVAASDRTDNAIAAWRLDPAARRLEPAARARIATPFQEVYGLCLGRLGTETLALATSTLGEVGLWTLAPSADGSVSATRLALFDLGVRGPTAIAEGCVIDDEAGVAYVAQEQVGIWRIPLDDVGARTLIDRVGEGRLVADVEGLALYAKPGGGGFLVASVQGTSQFALYSRGAGNAFIGRFAIGASKDGAADPVSGTDGIEVSAAPLGPAFPGGLVVAQDDANTAPAAPQNFKFVSWADVEAAVAAAPE